MNKMIITIVVAVCVLGMALIMLNEHASGEKPNFSTEQTDFNHIATVTSPSEFNKPTLQQSNSIKDTTVNDTAYLQDSTHALKASADSTSFKPYPAEDTKLPVKPQMPKSEPNIHPIAKISADMQASIKEKERHVAPQVAAPKPKPQVESKPQVKEVAMLEPKPVESKTKVKEVAQVESKPQAQSPSKAEKPETAKPKESSAKNIAAAKEKPLQIKKCVVFNRNTGATVRLQGAMPLKYRTSTLHNPERILVDLDGQWSIIAPGVPKNPMVTNVRIGKLPSKTRVVVDLKGKPAKSSIILSKDRQTLDVRVER
ncbi:MAG: AMIN domain-containing protein [Desulfovibrionaceae bacterium]|nr:AMIN domain-containing protein [Desulfovibrionaceae bacterium]